MQTTKQNLFGLSLKNLKKKCVDLGHPQSGSKSALVDRILSGPYSKKLSKKQVEVDRLFKPDPETGVSGWVSREDIDKTILNWGNNGNGRGGGNIYFGDTRYSWDIRRKGKGTTGKIEAMRTSGFNENHLLKVTHPIRKDILEYFRKQPCAFCGSRHDIQVDHKNGLYNDPRALNLATQTKDDFQASCRHCNIKKREEDKKSNLTKKRRGPPPHILTLSGIKYTEGDETFDAADPYWHKGTYWGDPIAFVEEVKRRQKAEKVRLKRRASRWKRKALIWESLVELIKPTFRFPAFRK